MEIILSVLHYQNLKTYDTLHAKELAAVALHSDKYDCTKALRPWISQWFGRIRGGSSTDDLALLLVAAYFFRASEHFKSVSARIVRQANANLSSIWASHDMMAFLPQELKRVRARDSANHGYGTTLTD
ncbi:hypothetical protein NKR23_g12296 [Pleurostoma richardsiae]|uniref:Uncharacterized protein n=1 Tax=Pleurostoma richardsiae TaxID=41990 RepID=A0AA38VCX6_9PEZI|nr:hypothetical protein NKR23_g12296 [Pleurostoma richardsiae]